MPEINQHGQTVNDIVPDWKCARVLTRTQPESVEATVHWVLGKIMDDDLVPFAVIDLRTEKAVGLVSYMAIERFRTRWRSAASPGRTG